MLTLDPFGGPGCEGFDEGAARRPFAHSFCKSSRVHVPFDSLQNYRLFRAA